ncbi:MAG: cytochrome c [Rhodobacteraceae bacterium]|nr:cytochrome c [Paracoccaceae bacterium]
MRQVLTLGVLWAIVGAAPVMADISIEDGAALFAAHYVACHGADGTGDGSAAAGLGTAAADLTEIAARRDGVWPMLDGYVRQVSPRAGMPAITALGDGPVVAFDTGNGQVTDVPARLLAIATYLESIQSPKPERYVP